jgi:hypothetical protein
MKLKLRQSDKELLIYREKWGVIAYVSILGLACLIIAAGAYFLSNETGAPSTFLIVFSLFFVFAGAALLLRLPVESKKAAGEGGFHVFSADSWGIAITADLGARKQTVSWASIEEVALAQKFKTIEFGETTHLGRTIIVFLTKDEYSTWSVLDRINAGASRSGSGRAYLHVPFPQSQEELLAEAIQQYAPARINVRIEKLEVFDYKRHADSCSKA